MTEYFVTCYVRKYPECRYGGQYDDTYDPPEFHLTIEAMKIQEEVNDCFVSYCNEKAECYNTKPCCDRRYVSAPENASPDCDCWDIPFLCINECYDAFYKRQFSVSIGMLTPEELTLFHNMTSENIGVELEDDPNYFILEPRDHTYYGPYFLLLSSEALEKRGRRGKLWHQQTIRQYKEAKENFDRLSLENQKNIKTLIHCEKYADDVRATRKSSPQPVATSISEYSSFPASALSGKGVPGTIPIEIAGELEAIYDPENDSADVQITGYTAEAIAQRKTLYHPLITAVEENTETNKQILAAVKKSTATRENDIFSGTYRAQTRFTSPDGFDEIELEKIQRLRNDGWKWKDVIREVYPDTPEEYIDSKVDSVRKQIKRDRESKMRRV